MADENVPPRSVNGDHEFTFKSVHLFKTETLGTGSYGAVCKAKCDQLICAAKLLYPVLFQMVIPDPGKEHRQPFYRFEQECRFLSRVNHPNIVQYLGTHRDPETNALVLLMELMDESLTHFLESSPGDIPYHVQVSLSQDIAQALAFLHANGIIHRDLSSNNVLLIAGSRAKVSDFGMSKFADLNTTRLATMTTCPGTPAFMPPEALDEPPVYTEKLDNFSFGVILVQILTKQFPKPSDRFVTEQFPDRQNPSRMIKARVLIPEVERRQSHISLIEPTHPLLPVALECLKDEAVERPSSQQLCQSLDALKQTAKNQRQDLNQLLHEQVQEQNQQIKAKDQNIEALEHEVETRKHEIEKLEHQIRRLNGQLESNEAATIEVEKLERQLRRLNGQLESNEAATTSLQNIIGQQKSEIAELREANSTHQNTISQRGKEITKQIEITSTLQQTIIESEKEIAALKDISLKQEHTITQKDKDIAILNETLSAKKSNFKAASTASNIEWHFKWESLPHPLKHFNQHSAVVNGKVYFTTVNSEIVEFDPTSCKWILFPRPKEKKYGFLGELCDINNFSLVAIENELTVVGGSVENWGKNKDSNKLYSYSERRWVEKYPPMLTRRWECTAVYKAPILIAVGGGRTTSEDDHGDDFLATVEILLNIYSRRWSKVRSLPFSTSQPSVSICTEYIYVYDTSAPLTEECCAVRCPLLTLLFSATVWEQFASLPVNWSTLVSAKGHLLAIGGTSPKGGSIKEIYRYDPYTNTWQVICQMDAACSECVTALLPNNRLIVVGGATLDKKSLCGLADLSGFT